MQPAAPPKPDLPYILGVIGAVLALGQAAMMLLVLLATFGFAPEIGPGELGFLLAIFGWITITALVGGVLMLVASLRLRKATGEARRPHGTWLIVGGVVSLLGGNMISAGLGIAGGAVALSSAPAVATA